MWNTYHSFLAVAETLNFSRAAERLGQNTSSVSRAVTRLEGHLGKRLIDRAPSVRLTDAGERLYTEIAPLFDGLLEAERAIQSDDGKVRGRIRVVGPQEVVRSMINPAIARMLDEKHDVHFEVEASTRVPNPLEEPVDVYLSHRRDEVTNKSLVARRICALPQGLFATPQLIGRRKLPQTPADLAQWPCLGRLGEPEWELIDTKGRKQVVLVRGAVFSTPSEARVDLALRGHGITQINLSQGNEAVELGQLVRILPGYTIENMSLHAFLLSRRLIPQAVQIFLRYTTEEARKYFPA
jgi:DNA-binding transcriptional LysR family regulator